MYAIRSYYGIDEAIHNINQGQFERAKQLIEQYQSAVVKLAEALLEHETLEGKHVEEILEYGEIRTPVLHTPLPPIESEDDADGVKKEKKDKKNQEGDLGSDHAPAGVPA